MTTNTTARIRWTYGQYKRLARLVNNGTTARGAANVLRVTEDEVMERMTHPGFHRAMEQVRGYPDDEE